MQTGRRVVGPALYMPDILYLGKQAGARAAAGPARQGKSKEKRQGFIVHVHTSEQGRCPFMIHDPGGVPSSF